MNQPRYYSGKRRTPNSPYWQLLTRPDRRQQFLNIAAEWQHYLRGSQ